MNPFSRLMGRVREQLVELGESLAGSQAERSLDDRIRRADDQLREWRASLAEFRAKHMAAKERHDATIAIVLQREAQTAVALQAGQDALATEVAAEIDRLEQARDDEAELMGHLDACIAQMTPLVEQGERQLRRLRHQLDVLRAAHAVQRAQEAVAGRGDGDAVRPQTALDSLARVRRQHEAASAPECAAVDTSSTGADTDPLDAKLQDAGVDRRARIDAILARIRASAEPAPTRPAGRATRKASS
ncbi:PspA/IM30 family protein [Cognatilysobacter terrigena]|uniref:PspA/IM30 family protein n=1 Tax=Cognatilysobacter terrigena TaxID=2488749 RepID=UPI00105B9527|nr:PspA/IM30 family protein [Lysobacter terrigena]